jgi:hypothetical protein
MVETTPMQIWLERAALAAATALTAFTLTLVPSWSGAWADPCRQAAVAAAATIVFLFATRHAGPRAIPLERTVMAGFLIAMPLVYVASWLTAGGGDIWLWIEIAGFPLYAALAVMGLKRSPWFLVAGIAGHGLAWDAWHLGSAYIPDWYAVGCLLVDVGMSLYVAARIPAWRAARVRSMRPHSPRSASVGSTASTRRAGT